MWLQFESKCMLCVRQSFSFKWNGMLCLFHLNGKACYVSVSHLNDKYMLGVAECLQFIWKKVRYMCVASGVPMDRQMQVTTPQHNNICIKT